MSSSKPTEKMVPQTMLLRQKWTPLPAPARRLSKLRRIELYRLNNIFSYGKKIISGGLPNRKPAIVESAKR
jgi:hypothetical protein